MGTEWLKPVLAKGMAMLLLLRLKNSPPEDAVKATLQTWFQIITYKKCWEQELDQWRFEEAFMRLSQTCDWFPNPKQLLEIMPPREIPALPEPVLTEEQREKNRAKLQAMMAQLRGKMVCKKQN